MPGVLWSTTAWAHAIARMPIEGALAARTVLVPRGPVAHALRKELVRAGRSDVLAGTLFVGPVAAASEVLRNAGVDFVPGEDRLRPSRLLRAIRDGLELEHFDRELLASTAGWDAAFARTLFDLEAAGLDPDALPDADAPWRDVATLWRAVDRSAGGSWTVQGILREAAALLVRDASLWPFDGPVLAAVTGHETAAHAAFVRAIPRVILALHGARPLRERHLARVAALYGGPSRVALASATAPRASATERDVLASYFFEPADLLARADRGRSAGVDGSVSIEEHPGVESELEAAADWIVREVRERATPLEEIAVLVPVIDPLAGLIVDRIHRVLAPEAEEPPVFVSGGLPARTTPAGARLSAVLAALRGHLALDAFAGVLPFLRAHDAEHRVARGVALELAYGLGTVGGNPACPRDALLWREHVGRRAAALEAAIARVRDEGSDDARALRSLERQLEALRALGPSIEALVALAERVLDGAGLGELWGSARAFFETHLLVPGGGAKIVAMLGAALDELCADPASRALTGPDALDAVQSALDALRVPVGRFGDPVVYVGTVQGAVGLRFEAVRVVGLVEGTIPSAPTEDPVLPSSLRSACAERGLVLPEDRAVAQLHALDRIVRDTSRSLSLSYARQGLDRSYREASSVILEAAAALGRRDGANEASVVPDTRALRRDAFAPARRAWRAARASRPTSDAAWLDRLVRGTPGVPARWLSAAHLDPRRARALLDSDASGALDGLLGGAQPAPRLSIPGLEPERPISPSALRVFLECPHRFLFEKVFHWSEPFAPPPQRSLAAHAYGSLLHHALELLYRAHGAAITAGAGAIADHQANARSFAELAFGQHLETSPLVSAAIRAHELERLVRDVARIVEDDWTNHRARWVDCERAFGEPVPVAWSGADGEVHLHVRGRIDRIDADARTTYVRDYKTGKPTLRAEGDSPDPVVDVQLAVYAHVVRASARAWSTPARVSAEYVYVRPTGIERRTWGADEDELRAQGDAWASLAGRMMRALEFPRTPREEDCRYCPFQVACGEDRASRARRVLARGGGALTELRRLKSSEEAPE